MNHMDSSGNAILVTTLVALFGLIAAEAVRRYRKQKLQVTDRHVTLIPQLNTTASGRIDKLEKFSTYVARQIGFSDDSKVPQLCKLANEYLTMESKKCELNIFEFFENEPNGESLYVKLVEELDRCILGYFAYHWNHADDIIRKLLDGESTQRPKLQELLLTATRELRFEQITKELKVQRLFCTLVKEMKAIDSDSESVVPRPPILVLMGGGMGAGKSTVLEDIKKESMWTGSKPVVVEADDFTREDVIYRALNSRGRHNDMLQSAELVHKSSTDAASSVLVTVLNKGKDVIMDGTLSWEPYVEQTIAMARNIHKRKYRLGVGEAVEDGTTIESYWEETNEEQEEQNRLAYRIELVGVVCDPYLAVVRGIRRALTTKRSVRVNSQLASHKRFASAFRTYCELVDNARLFSTNDPGCPPKLVASMDEENNLTVDDEAIKLLKMTETLNPEAESIHDIYDKDSSPLSEARCIWKDFVLLPARRDIQKELRKSIVKVEKKLVRKQYNPWLSNLHET